LDNPEQHPACNKSFCAYNRVMIMALMLIKPKPLPVVFLEMHVLQQLKYKSEMCFVFSSSEFGYTIESFQQAYSMLHWDI